MLGLLEVSGIRILNNILPEPHNCYGNPFLEKFPAAVTEKAKWAIANNIDTESLFKKVVNGDYAEFLGEAELEIFLYPHPKKLAEAEEIFQALTEMVAILAFCSHGIDMFGYHFEVIDRQIVIEKIYPAPAPQL